MRRFMNPLLEGRRAVAPVAVMVLVAACTGSIDERQAPGDSGDLGGRAPGAGASGRAGSGGTNTGGAGPAGDPTAAGPMPFRRLSRVEYNNTVRDLLGDKTAPADAFPADVPGSSGFDTPSTVGDVEVERFQEAAEALAATAAKNLPKLLPCDPTKGEDACAAQFVTTFGGRAWRRPVTTDEATTLSALYKQVRAAPLSYDFTNAARVLIVAMLQSPRFLYHWEGAAAAPIVEGGVVKLGPYEVASRLSYFLWQTMPDQALFDAAAAGKLASAADVEVQAKRLLADARARDAVIGFHAQWLALAGLPSAQKDLKVYPTWNVSLAQAMRAETDAFVSHAVLEDGHLETLLGARYSFVNAALAKHYGIAGVTSATPVRMDLPAARAGLLTQASFLTMAANTYESSPVKRGKLVRERLLCQSIPPPPPDVDTTPPKAATGNVSTREAYAVHASNAACKSCHMMMDPLGFAFEGFDGIGASRTMDGGKPVDATGTLSGLDGGDVPFRDAADLAGKLTASEQVAGCLGTQWLRFAYGRADVDADRASLAAAMSTFRDARFDVRELLAGLARSRSFLYRAPSAGEVLP